MKIHSVTTERNRGSQLIVLRIEAYADCVEAAYTRDACETNKEVSLVDAGSDPTHPTPISPTASPHCVEEITPASKRRG